MRVTLAEQLLAKIMEWSPEEVSNERPLLQALANFKYDEYQQFSPGIRFIESLAQLRRYAHLDNEQVLTTYFIDNEKIKDLQNELKSNCNEEKFSSIFLIDDFTASGTSYARFELDNTAKGKIFKLLNKIYKSTEGKDQFSNLVERENLSIHVIFYIATDMAITNIKSAIEEYIDINKLKIDYSINVVQLMGDKVKKDVLANSDFISLIKQDSYFDDSIVDKHFQKGMKNNEPYLGFAECGLPLVLFHNTPNNSIPIIWFSEDKKIKGLFPRITRHKE